MLFLSNKFGYNGKEVIHILKLSIIFFEFRIICDMIKQNESELSNTDFKISKANKVV